jgi:hypothetical protein
MEVNCGVATQGEKKGGYQLNSTAGAREPSARTFSRHVRESPSQRLGRRLGATWNWGPETSPPLPEVLEDWGR